MKICLRFEIERQLFPRPTPNIGWNGLQQTTTSGSSTRKACANGGRSAFTVGGFAQESVFGLAICHLRDWTLSGLLLMLLLWRAGRGRRHRNSATRCCGPKAPTCWEDGLATAGCLHQLHPLPGNGRRGRRSFRRSDGDPRSERGWATASLNWRPKLKGRTAPATAPRRPHPHTRPHARRPSDRSVSLSCHPTRPWLLVQRTGNTNLSLTLEALVILGCSVVWILEHNTCSVDISLQMFS